MIMLSVRTNNINSNGLEEPHIPTLMSLSVCPCTQWAAVMAQFSLRRAAPHLCRNVAVLHCLSETCQGHSPYLAFSPAEENTVSQHHTIY